jgi:ubiquinone/menaquinone biosynthesis C-methylase UbiE
MNEIGDAFLDSALAEEREIMDEYAPEYRRWTMTGGLVYRVERREFVAWALEMLRRSGRDPRELRFLDVGCGTGELLEELHNAGCRSLSGFDLSEAMLAETRRSIPDATLVAGALESHSLPPRSFDVVMAAFTVHHLADPSTFFRTAEQVLAPGGFLFVLDYNSASASYSGWTRLATRLAVAPFRFLIRWKNRKHIAAQPKLYGKFSRAHRLLSMDDLSNAARSAGFTPEVVTRGLFGPWFLHDTFESSGFDRAFLRVVQRVDQSLIPAQSRSFQWMAARQTRDH